MSIVQIDERRRGANAIFSDPDQPEALRVLLVAPPKRGKSYAACTWPGPKMIDSERAGPWMKQAGFNLQTISVRTVYDARTVVDKLVALGNDAPGDTIILELGPLHQRLTEAVPADQRMSDGKPTQGSWFRIKELEKGLVDTLCRSPKHVVITSWARVYTAKNGDVIKVLPDYDEDVLHAVDFAFFLRERRNETNTIAQCIASRSPKIRIGQVIEHFSYTTLLKALGFTQTPAASAAPAATPAAAPTPQPAQHAATAAARIESTSLEAPHSPPTSPTPTPRKDYTPSVAVPPESVHQAVKRMTRDVYTVNGFGTQHDGTVHHTTDRDHFDLRRCVAIMCKLKSVPIRWGDFSPEHLHSYLLAPLLLENLRKRDDDERTRLKKHDEKPIGAVQIATIKSFINAGRISERDVLKKVAQFKKPDGTPKEKIEQLSWDEGVAIVKALNG